MSTNKKNWTEMRLDFNNATMNFSKVNEFLHSEGLPQISESDENFTVERGEVLLSSIKSFRKDINFIRLESQVPTGIPYLD
jgi:hypothetical protein